ncbi:5-dehydro-2-deoxygluconokinase [Dongia sp.]|uniref:bifunctional 5-dehydro-2-deoxygluconokinase/5-dehydro-2- deoxyphosphogluconate aldolase n=1 Tax=Dongia sp. TaxID=1977262 RepID=UPI0035B2DE9B
MNFPPKDARKLDVISIGRSSVDLYGQQAGGRLEDMASFAKYIGGCPTNIAVGASRLGLRAAVITRVGDEHMGRFIREQLAAEGVDTRGVATDPARLTALVILGIRDKEHFPLIFYRENCADMALEAADIDPAFINEARAVLVTGTHLSKPNLAAASKRAMDLARRNGAVTILDIDYRPVLWGIGGHGTGDIRFVDNAAVSQHLLAILPACEIVVGTEEEVHIAGASTDTLTALRNIRARTKALIVMKRGPLGCVAYPDAIPTTIDAALVDTGFPVEVYNVLGAGDGFMSGLLRGLLGGETLPASMRMANACGALVVSRHGCAPASPTWRELKHFLDHGSAQHALRKDVVLNDLHWSTTRRRAWPEICALAFDHRVQLERLAAQTGAAPARIPVLKRLIYEAAAKAFGDDPAFGIILDDRFGSDVLAAATGRGHWIARPVELPEQIPLVFEGGRDIGNVLREWPVEHTVKCLVYQKPADGPDIAAPQEDRLLALFEACRQTGHELLLEIIPDKTRPGDGAMVAAMIRRYYDLGLKPDWWKLSSPDDQAGWTAITEVVRSRDPDCRGVLLLGLDAPEPDLVRTLTAAAAQPICRGFAIGRSVFSQPAESWLQNRTDDAAFVAEVAARYRRLIDVWRQARGRHSAVA